MLAASCRAPERPLHDELVRVPVRSLAYMLTGHVPSPHRCGSCAECAAVICERHATSALRYTDLYRRQGRYSSCAPCRTPTLRVVWPRAARYFRTSLQSVFSLSRCALLLDRMPACSMAWRPLGRMWSRHQDARMWREGSHCGGCSVSRCERSS